MKNAIIIILIVITVGAIGIIAYALKGQPQSDSDKNKSSTPEIALNNNDHVRGDSNSPITLVEYSDFQCPFCVKFHPVMMQLTDEYQGKVRWVYRHYPLPFHKAAKGAAIAAEAAGKQGKFWEYSVKLSENSQQDGTGLQEADLVKYGQDLGLDLDKFNNDRKSSSLVRKIDNDIATGDSLRIKGTPSLFLIDNAGKIEQIEPGTLPELKAKIDEKLK